MNALRPLQTLLEQAERERDAVLLTYRQAAEAAAQAQAQHEQLLNYQSEYVQRWRQQLRTEATIALLQSYQGFMDRLQTAVDQQQQVVNQAKARCDREQLRLREHELRTASVRKLIERRVVEIQRGIERRDQKEMDAHAARMLSTRASPLAAAPMPNQALSGKAQSVEAV